jgi:uncharacterized tellurite resistance protein B-like protein
MEDRRTDVHEWRSVERRSELLTSIKSFFSKNLEPDTTERPKATVAGSDHDPISVAACALLLELAHADDEFTDDEREHIEAAMAHHFDLSEEMVGEVVALAEQERQRSVDLYQFTRLIADRYDLGQKMVLAEVMWRVVYADGELAKHESYLMRKISNLLDLKPGFLSEARNRVRDQAD